MMVVVAVVLVVVEVDAGGGDSVSGEVEGRLRVPMVGWMLLSSGQGGGQVDGGALRIGVGEEK
ncbi:hypothetical protein E2C01_056405 [Portunus trituberculatus]|uniref:Secreted protein n=1 Tax=Portunus trituberculatus TaxID=210409 RepID=A0A5B7GQ90_PORTR|nr:hypothetical protein [Portunus trituberculatus]